MQHCCFHLNRGGTIVLAISNIQEINDHDLMHSFHMEQVLSADMLLRVNIMLLTWNLEFTDNHMKKLREFHLKNDKLAFWPYHSYVNCIKSSYQQLLEEKK